MSWLYEIFALLRGFSRAWWRGDEEDDDAS